MPKRIYWLSGLHCPACEMLIENKLRELPGVLKAQADYRNGRLEINSNGSFPEPATIARLLAPLGYHLKPEKQKVKSKNKISDYWLSVVLGLIILYWLISHLHFFDLSSFLSGRFSLAIALLIGLVAGVSTCLALVGGLVLGAAANYNKDHPGASRWQKFRPHLLFNAGRVGGFFLLGGLLGALGSSFKLSPLTSGALSIVVALVMLSLGFKLLGIFPFLQNLNFRWPKRWGRNQQNRQPLILGVLTFFLPCGFTQAMQVEALGSGNFWMGGAIMALFALGTIPGLLGIGGLASLPGQKKSRFFFQIAGALVIIFALITFRNGWQLSKVSLNSYHQNSEIILDSNTKNDSDAQTVRMTESGRGYAPNEFTVIKGRPVRWIIDAQAPYSCASSLIMPALNIEKRLRPGENIIEFTPSQAGDLPFSCSMGMYTGVFHVVEK